MKTAEEILKHKGMAMAIVDQDTPINDALKVMNDKHIGSILVKKNEKIVGIWTERDLMQNCLDDNFDPKKNTVKEFMSTKLQSATHNSDVYELMDKFLGKRMRHLLIEKDGDYIGILSSGDVMRATMAEKDEEFKKLNSMVSWDYYENWKWEKTKISTVTHNEEGLRVDLK